MTPDEVLAELRSIRSKQADLDPASSDYRSLENRRLELASLAQTALDASHGRAALARELSNLEQRLDRLEDDKIEVPTWQQAMQARKGLSINDPAAHASQINAAHDKNAAADRASIEARISQLKSILAE